MLDLAIIIPVLRRPQNIRPLVESIITTTTIKRSFEIVFVTSPGDNEEIEELENQKQLYITMEANYERKGDYARKINRGFNAVEAQWYFLGADDLIFHSYWFEFALNMSHRTKACVVGTNDLGSPIVLSGKHATHSLVHRDYILECGTIDELGKVLHEGYSHNFVDSEFVETAKYRGTWAFCYGSKVEHNHPDWKKAPRDEIYDIGRSGWSQDEQYFKMRKKLWI